ncbi:MAG TPA: BrnT family toxin [Mycobacteriales bacterium]|nr:BrnT family toxin [Mycobacteriales bacterium]
MDFEYDEKKSAANQEKHGLDFADAQALWRDLMRVEIPARTVDEPRWLVIGRINGRHWSAVVTYRGKKVRIISVRRSRDEGVKIYEG